LREEEEVGSTRPDPHSTTEEKKLCVRHNIASQATKTIKAGRKTERK